MIGYQLAFDLDLPPALSRADFIVGAGNRDALATIEAWPNWPVPVLLLTGPEGSGKTHLAEIWRARSGASTVHAAGLTATVGEGLSLADAVIVEDLDWVDGREAALFHLLNRARELGATVLLTARDRDRVLSSGLADLRSRLRAAQPLTLTAPDDALLGMVLVKLFADRQLAVTSSVVEYLVRRMERSCAAATILVRKLDEAALSTGRPISRQLAAPFLAGSHPDTDTEGN